MTTNDAFLAAIVADPEDDLPRLVYADWLDEHGDPDRAEFIRLQVAAARGDESGSDRAGELLAANKPRWEIPDIHGVQSFRRGFVEGVRMAGEEFVAHAERIGRAAPVTAVRLSVVAEVVGELVRVPWLSRVEELDLSNNVGMGGWLAFFLDGVPLSNLRTLELRNNQLWPEAVGVIASRVPRSPHLTRLNLSGNPIADEGLQALADSASFGILTDLVLRCEMLPYIDSAHAAGAAALARSRYLNRLRSLDLAGHYIGDAGLADLARSSNARSLERLDVSQNEIGTVGDSGVEAVVESPHLGRLRAINLSGNAVGWLAAEALANWPQLRGMESVNLSDCVFGGNAYPILSASHHRDKFILDEPTLTT